MFRKKQLDDDVFQKRQDDMCLGKLSAVFGGVTCNLLDAKIKDGAHLRVFCMFGGAEILVPEDVRIKQHTFCIFGGMDDKRKPKARDDFAKTLHIHGFCMFGGVDIK